MSEIFYTILGVAISTGCIVLLTLIIKSLLSKNKWLVSSLLTALTGGGFGLFLLGEKIDSFGLSLVGIYLFVMIGPVCFIYLFIFVISLLFPSCKLPEKSKKPTFPKPPCRGITYFHTEWSIEQFRNAQKLSDLFIDYCEVDGCIRIVRVLSMKLYFALMTIERGKREPPLTMVRYLNRDLQGKLLAETLTYDDLIGEIYNWSSLEERNAAYSKSDVRNMVRAAEESRQKDRTDGNTKNSGKTK